MKPLLLILTNFTIKSVYNLTLRSATKDFYTWFHNTSSDDPAKKFIIDNKMIAVDYDNTLPPNPNCLTTGFDSPTLLIYCLISAIIWLSAVSAGLYFYFKKLFKSITSSTNNTYKEIELENIANGFATNRENIVGKSMDSKQLHRLLPSKSDSGN